MGSALKSHFMSHGEVLKEFTVNRIKDAKNCVLLLDEPESALSLRNQYKLAKEIKNATNNGVQLIIATHCLPIIEHFDNVYSLEHQKWMLSKKFINENKQ
jgi:predicted ATPase